MEKGYPADHGLSYRKIEEVASRVRKVVAPEATLALPGVRLLESLDRYKVKTKGRIIPLAYAVSGVPFGVEAHTAYQREQDEVVITLSEVTYRSLEEEDPRARFTLCHELGHAVLHSEELVRLSELPHTQAALMRGVYATHEVFRDTEWQANGFSSAMLMPLKLMKEVETRNAGRLTTALVQSRFGVSRMAAETRLAVYRRNLL
jgi:Zn-dependent peptidase ImmA (M78 family)